MNYFNKNDIFYVTPPDDFHPSTDRGAAGTWIIPGKVYKAQSIGGHSFNILDEHINDSGHRPLCLLHGCAHLHNNNWVVVDDPHPIPPSDTWEPPRS